MKNNKRNKKKKNNAQTIWKTLGGNLIIWVLIIIMAVTALQFFSTDYKIQIIDYTQFQDYLEQDLIELRQHLPRFQQQCAHRYPW